MKGEHAKFLGFRKICGNTVAVFNSGFSEWVMDQQSCETRLHNLQRGGYPCEQTQDALNSWPIEEEAGL